MALDYFAPNISIWPYVWVWTLLHPPPQFTMVYRYIKHRNDNNYYNCYLNKWCFIMDNVWLGNSNSVRVNLFSYVGRFVTHFYNSFCLLVCFFAFLFYVCFHVFFPFQMVQRTEECKDWKTRDRLGSTCSILSSNSACCSIPLYVCLINYIQTYLLIA